MDNASPDGTVAAIANEFPQVNIIVNEKNLGYAAAVNRGVRSLNAGYYIVSNSDVVYPAGSIDKILACLREHPEYGALGVQQVYADGSWQRSFDDVPGIVYGLKDITFYRKITNIFRSGFWKMGLADKKVRGAGYIDGAMLAFPREAYDAVTGWDEDYFFYTEEADFCHRLKKAGYKIVFNPSITITHLRGGTTKDIAVSRQYIKMLFESKGIFYRKHYGRATAKAAVWLGIVYCIELIIIYYLMYIVTFFGARYGHKVAAMKDSIKELRNELKKI